VLLDEAVTNGWIAGAVYAWTGTGYENAKFTGSYQPGKGYWLKALVNGCSLVFYRP